MRRKINLKFDSTPTINHECNLVFAKEYIKGKKVLDVGCWTGQFEILATKYTKRITGIDPKASAIKYAQKNIPNAKFLIGKAERLPFPNQSFDTVVLIDVLEHLPKSSEPIALKEINRVLKNNGTLIISTPNNHFLSILMDPAYFIDRHRHYSLKTLKQFLEGNNFSIIKTCQTGKIYRLITSNIETFYKHLLHSKPIFPKWIKQKIDREYTQGGYAQNHIIAQKIN